MENQSKIQKGNTERKNILGVVVPAAQMSPHQQVILVPQLSLHRGSGLSHPVAAGWLAKAVGVHLREEHTLPGSKVVILLPWRI